MAMQHLAVLEEWLVGVTPCRYNRHQNQVYLDTDWTYLEVGSYLIVECYGIIDPTAFPDVWNDSWF